MVHIIYALKLSSHNDSLLPPPLLLWPAGLCIGLYLEWCVWGRAVAFLCGPWIEVFHTGQVATNLGVLRIDPHDLLEYLWPLYNQKVRSGIVREYRCVLSVQCDCIYEAALTKPSLPPTGPLAWLGFVVIKGSPPKRLRIDRNVDLLQIIVQCTCNLKEPTLLTKLSIVSYSKKRKLGLLAALEPWTPFVLMAFLWTVWVYASPIGILETDPRLFLLTMGIHFSNITVSHIYGLVVVCCRFMCVWHLWQYCVLMEYHCFATMVNRQVFSDDQIVT